MAEKYNIRVLTAKAVNQVLEQGLSLSQVLPVYQNSIPSKDRALLQELCFGVLREYSKLEWIAQQLMKKAFTRKLRCLHYLILTGLYQLIYTRIPAHAAVAETVNGAVVLKQASLKGVINGVLRQFLRQQDTLIAQADQSDARYLHPQWLLTHIQAAYPTQWQDIIQANNQKPPVWLRVNRQHHTALTYQALLEEQKIISFASAENPYALRLETFCPVDLLPGFNDGWVSIQDLSAQDAALWLAPENHQNILDLCAAPGGKTTHILEIAPDAKVLAVDVDPQRIMRIKENITRLHQTADIKVGDALHPQQWCAPDKLFDAILIDAPCSATGVIRRHSDIKWLRRETDIATLAHLQSQILDSIWPYLKAGGHLVYTTCSILPEENQQQITQFLQRHKQALLTNEPIQVLPKQLGGDGFFYAKIQKKLL